MTRWARLEIAGTAADLALLSLPETNPWAAQLQIGRLDLHESSPGEAGWRRIALEADDADRRAWPGADRRWSSRCW